MGERQHIQSRIDGLERQIDIHRDKISGAQSEFCVDERLNFNLNTRIEHWEKEIEGWQDQIANLRDKL